MKSAFIVTVEYQAPVSPPTTQEQAEEQIAKALRNGLSRLWPRLAVDGVEVKLVAAE
jgi:hypothetical protein